VSSLRGALTVLCRRRGRCSPQAEENRNRVAESAVQRTSGSGVSRSMWKNIDSRVKQTEHHGAAAVPGSEPRK
jgi:hypothetical protein